MNLIGNLFRNIASLVQGNPEQPTGRTWLSRLHDQIRSGHPTKLKQSTDYKGHPSRQVDRAVRRAMNKGWPQTDSSMHLRVRSRAHTQKQHYSNKETVGAYDGLKGFSSAKLLRKALAGEIGLARIR